MFPSSDTLILVLRWLQRCLANNHTEVNVSRPPGSLRAAEKKILNYFGNLVVISLCFRRRRWDVFPELPLRSRERGGWAAGREGGGNSSTDLFFFFESTPYAPEGSLVNLPSPTHTDSTHFHRPAHVTEAINSHRARHGDKASKQSIKQTQADDESGKMWRNDARISFLPAAFLA